MNIGFTTSAHHVVVRYQGVFDISDSSPIDIKRDRVQDWDSDSMYLLILQCDGEPTTPVPRYYWDALGY